MRDDKLLRDRLGVLSPTEFGRFLEVSVETLREWRRLGLAPDYVKAGKSVLYREDDITGWMKRNVVVAHKSPDSPFLSALQPIHNGILI